MRVAFSILLSIGLSISHAQADAEIPSVSGGKVHVELPASASSDQLQQLEWSTNLVDWEPVAREYKEIWENTYPHRVEISGESPGSLPFPTAGNIRSNDWIDRILSGYRCCRGIQQSTVHVFRTVD